MKKRQLPEYNCVSKQHNQEQKVLAKKMLLTKSPKEFSEFWHNIDSSIQSKIIRLAQSLK